MRCTVGGDEHVFAEVDEAISLEAFFRGPSIANAVRDSRIRGVTEICPADASFPIEFDPEVIAHDDLLRELRRPEGAGGSGAELQTGSSRCRSSTTIPGPARP